MKKVNLDFYIDSTLAMAYLMACFGCLIVASWQLEILNGANASLIITGLKMAFIGALYLVLTPVIRHTVDLPVRPYYRSSLFFGLLLFGFTSEKLVSIDALGFESGLLLCSILPLLFALLILRIPLISEQENMAP